MSIYILSFFYCLLLFSSIVGFSYIFLSIQKFFFNRGRNKIHTFVVVPLSGHLDDAEMSIREIRSLNKGKNVSILFVDMGLDRETFCICQNTIDTFGDCVLCDYNQFAPFINYSFNSL